MHFADIFGPDRFYLELMEQGIEEQRKVNQRAAARARQDGAAPRGHNDAHT
jgi:DNA polymerase III alpha subunit